MSKYSLGIDIGGTFIKYALVDNEYNIKEKWKVKTIKFDTKDEFYDYVCSNIKHNDLIDVIGVSAPGLISKESDVKSLAAPNVAIMYNTNINNEIMKRTNKRVSSINDAKSAGLCEFKIGNAQNTSFSAFLILGTGTGGCLCNEKGVIYGRDFYAGEFHNIPSNTNSNNIGRMGDYSSILGLINTYNKKVDEAHATEYGQEVCNKYLEGDEIAKEAVEEWLNNIATQLITITVFYNPEVICIGGGISEEDWFIEKLKECYKKRCSEYLGGNFITTEISRCKYNNDANILGAIINTNVYN